MWVGNVDHDEIKRQMTDGASSEFTNANPQQGCPRRPSVAGVFYFEEITRPEAVHALSTLFAKPATHVA